MIDYNVRKRSFMIILYNDTEENKRKLDKCIELCIFSGFKYAFIIHDKDINDDKSIKKEHIHLLITLPNAKTRTALSKMINIDENYIQPVTDKSTMIRYLIHLDNPEKTPYNREKIFTNMQNIVNTAIEFGNNETEEVFQASILIDFINSDDCKSFKELMKFAIDNNVYSTLRRGATLYTILLKEKLKKY